ncbi:flagellar hook-associated protein FlgL [Bacillus sp. FJAT-49736]|uniref:flagellar hook-associated protein FlgL n=1 Tax=Bacillus sp. FJAT-49736 TaxID=2833582 RepID=UPI001BC9E958|nr:flagellar hook-associated protein FlgL [Bacillus sp. FJAT-49736]MBS4174163.1 flagellar hook-associated protein FlgL [Bacillus sp. FJAT-49736]
MRVTQSMLSNNFLKNLNTSYDKMGKLQDQVASQKKINRPSDDPVIAMKGVGYRTNLQEVEQYKRNFSEAHNWIDNTDSALDEATQAMQRIRELTVEASNGTLTDDQRGNIAKEISQLKDHLVEIANTKVGDKYIFNGTDTTNKPVDLKQSPPKYPDNSNPVKIELSKGVYIQVNSDPNNIFSKDFFDELTSLEDTLNSTEPTGIDQYLEKLDTHINNIVNERATIGARSNRIDLMEDRVGQQEVSATKMMSDNEDADLDRVITDLVNQESVQRAALGIGARIIQPTLLDFLR